MSANTVSVLEASVRDAYTWLNEIKDTLGYDDKHFALQALRGVLHALRDRLTVDQNAHLSAQLPLLIRVIYFENWNPSPLPNHERSLERFMEHVRPSLGGYEGLDLQDVVGAVFRVLESHLSFGEDEKIAKVLPRELAALWNRNSP
jgi:uncharacterized protein (DUF2267 family)